MGNVIAKMNFGGIRTFISSGEKCASLEFSVVGHDTDEENKKFFKWTPSGSMTLSTVNQAVIETLELGQSYYIVITKEKPEGL